MIDASYALGMMTFSTLGMTFTLVTWEYLRTRRELRKDKTKSTETQIAREAIPAQG